MQLLTEIQPIPLGLKYYFHFIITTDFLISCDNKVKIIIIMWAIKIIIISIKHDYYFF